MQLDVTAPSDPHEGIPLLDQNTIAKIREEIRLQERVAPKRWRSSTPSATSSRRTPFTPTRTPASSTSWDERLDRLVKGESEAREWHLKHAAHLREWLSANSG